MEINDIDNKKKIIESLLFSSTEPIKIDRLTDIVKIEVTELKNIIELMNNEYLESHSFHISEVAEGFQICTREEFYDWIKKLFVKRKKLKLSRQAIETLSIIAYEQPITKPEIEKIRGVDSSYILRSLMEKELIYLMGRKSVPGNPLIYGTSDRFLEHFGLRQLSDLPSLEELGIKIEREFEEASQELPFDDVSDEGDGGLEKKSMEIKEKESVETKSDLTTEDTEKD